MVYTKQSTLRRWITGVTLWSVLLAVVSEGPGNHDEATNACSKRGGLAFVKGKEKEHWLPLKRYRRDNFIWIDGSSVKSQDVRDAEQCGGLDVTSGKLLPVSCDGPRWHICQYPDPSDKTDVQVIVCGQKFSLRLSTNNWYAANSSCAFEGGHLAILADPRCQEELNNWIKELHKTTTIIYVGFRQTDWIIPDNPDLNIHTWPWDNEEPRSQHDCAVAVTKGDKYYWKTEDCQQEHLYKCEDVDVDVDVKDEL